MDYATLRYSILKYHREMALEETRELPYENIKYAMHPHHIIPTT